jgi:hypothetical protein
LRFTRKFRCACGYFFKHRFSSLKGFPLSFMIRKTWSALMMPSPVVVKSRKIMWPLCSPPTLRLRAIISSST